MTSDTANSKKVYTITEEGKTFAQEKRGEHERRGPRRAQREQEAEMSEIATIMSELRECGPLAIHALKAASHDPAKRERLRATNERLRHELVEISTSGEYV